MGGSLQPALFQDDDATIETNVRDELAVCWPELNRCSRASGAIPIPMRGLVGRQIVLSHWIVLPGFPPRQRAYHGVISDCAHRRSRGQISRRHGRLAGRAFPTLQPFF
jgi:hypothetical protein